MHREKLCLKNSLIIFSYNETYLLDPVNESDSFLA